MARSSHDAAQWLPAARSGSREAMGRVLERRSLLPLPKWTTNVRMPWMRFAPKGHNHLPLGTTLADLDDPTSPALAFQLTHPPVETYGAEVIARFAHARALSGVNPKVGNRLPD
jgi:hypothetical protein